MLLGPSTAEARSRSIGSKLHTSSATPESGRRTLSSAEALRAVSSSVQVPGRT
jgi:hypothetical protein